MSQRNLKHPLTLEREAAEVRHELMRRAEAQSITPFTSLEEFAGDPELTADFDVDEFLRQVREDRARTLNRRAQ